MRFHRPLPFTTAISGFTRGTGPAAAGEASYMLTRPLRQAVAQNVLHRIAIQRGAVAKHQQGQKKERRTSWLMLVACFLKEIV